MRASHTKRKPTRDFKQNVNRPGAAIEISYSSMTIEEIQNCKPKSRLESFLRRKALEKKSSDKLYYK